MTDQISDLQTHWPPIAPVFLIRTESEYDAAVVRMNALLDKIGTNESHPLYGLLDTLGTLVHTYEAEHHVIPSDGGPSVLQYLMDEHRVSALDLSEIAPVTTIEQYLTGNAELSLNQVRGLARRFHVSPSAFF